MTILEMNFDFSSLVKKFVHPNKSTPRFWAIGTAFYPVRSEKGGFFD